MRATLALMLALCATPILAQTTPTDCDHLAGYDHTPRLPGLPGIHAVLDPPAAIAACEAALAAPGADPFLNFLLARALLVADLQDPRAVALIEAGRPASSPFADSRLGVMLDEGWGGLTPDPARATALATAACAAFPDRMAWAGCHDLANAQVAGDDPVARAEGLARHEALCDLGLAMSCGSLGSHYHDGVGVETDHPRALAYFDRSCAGGDGWGCGWAGEMREYGRGTGIDLPGAYADYARGCTLGYAWTCYAQGLFLSQGVGTERDWAGGLALLDRACMMGADDGCFHLSRGLLYGMDRNGEVTPDGMRRAIDHFATRCTEDSGRACTQLAFAVFQGTGVARDPVQALQLNTRACDLGDMLGCSNLGVQYGLGQGVEQDEDRALAL